MRFVTLIFTTLRRPPRIILGSGWRSASFAPCAPVVSSSTSGRFTSNVSATVSTAISFSAHVPVTTAFTPTAFTATVFTTSPPAAHAAAAASTTPGASVSVSTVAVTTVAHRGLLGSGALFDLTITLALLLSHALKRLHFLTVFLSFLKIIILILNDFCI
jgi:hypothetical protein